MTKWRRADNSRPTAEETFLVWEMAWREFVEPALQNMAVPDFQILPRGKGYILCNARAGDFHSTGLCYCITPARFSDFLVLLCDAPPELIWRVQQIVLCGLPHQLLPEKWSTQHYFPRRRFEERFTRSRNMDLSRLMRFSHTRGWSCHPVGS